MFIVTPDKRQYPTDVVPEAFHCRWSQSRAVRMKACVAVHLNKLRDVKIKVGALKPDRIEAYRNTPSRPKTALVVVSVYVQWIAAKHSAPMFPAQTQPRCSKI